MSSTFLTAEWRKLIMAQYAIDPAILTPYLPGGLELDLFGPSQICYVSLIGFLFANVRIKGIPPPFHTTFEEINLRFYVKRLMPNDPHGHQTRRGVVFIKEIVPKPAITLIARALYGEAYATAPTTHLWRSSPTQLDVNYSWQVPKPVRSRKWQHISAQASPTPEPITPGSLEEFITEHYWGYTLHTGLVPRRGATGEYGVAHPRWLTYPIHESHIEADFGALYGPAFAHLTQRPPDHVLLAEGSAIAIRSGSHFTAQPPSPTTL